MSRTLTLSFDIHMSYGIPQPTQKSKQKEKKIQAWAGRFIYPQEPGSWFCQAGVGTVFGSHENTLHTSKFARQNVPILHLLSLLEPVSITP